MNRLFASYLVLSGVALLGAHRPPFWPILAALHLALAAWGFMQGPPRADRPAALRWLGDAYPLIVMPLLYVELPLLNRALYAGRYFDPMIIGIERTLFGFEPARELAARLPYGWLSESLLAAYVSYYLIIYVPPFAIAWKQGHAALREAVFTLSLVFFAHYLFFVWFPVEGPRYRFESPVPADARGAVYALAHSLLEAGSSRGAAFPSSHVGVSVAATIVCWRRLRPATPLVALLTIGLAVGAVYGGFHYAVDAIAGGVLGAALAAIAPTLLRRAERPRPSP